VCPHTWVSKNAKDWAQRCGPKIVTERMIMDLTAASRPASALLLLATGVLGLPAEQRRLRPHRIHDGGAYYRRGDRRWQIRS
jgi:hypothetical protein